MPCVSLRLSLSPLSSLSPSDISLQLAASSQLAKPTLTVLTARGILDRICDYHYYRPACGPGCLAHGHGTFVRGTSALLPMYLRSLLSLALPRIRQTRYDAVRTRKCRYGWRWRWRLLTTYYDRPTIPCRMCCDFQRGWYCCWPSIVCVCAEEGGDGWVLACVAPPRLLTGRAGLSGLVCLNSELWNLDCLFSRFLPTGTDTGTGATATSLANLACCVSFGWIWMTGFVPKGLVRPRHDFLPGPSLRYSGWSRGGLCFFGLASFFVLRYSLQRSCQSVLLPALSTLARSRSSVVKCLNPEPHAPRARHPRTLKRYERRDATMSGRGKGRLQVR